MTGVTEVLWLGILLGVGAALSVGPIFVVIIQQAATSGWTEVSVKGDWTTVF